MNEYEEMGVRCHRCNLFIMRGNPYPTTCPKCSTGEDGQEFSMVVEMKKVNR